ncbi:hypothetical protein Ocin01_10806 [Orchesella cincta]|uniref:EGF-like domain-containing protein n=1 Tax=Orchesella cincta TaxID=48709 RepID=A0A1D2MSI1_ORCCI|nr:hypothetical protein Ocin01_10806 [Orchesella cincta]
MKMMDWWPTFFVLMVIVHSTFTGRPHQMNPYRSNPSTGPVILEIPDEPERTLPEAASAQLPIQSPMKKSKAANVESTVTATDQHKVSSTSSPSQTQTKVLRINPTKQPQPNKPSKLPTFPPHTENLKRKPIQEKKRDIEDWGGSGDDGIGAMLNPVQRIEVQADALQNQYRNRRVPDVNLVLHATPFQNLGSVGMLPTAGAVVRPYGECRYGEFANNKKTCQEGESCIPRTPVDPAATVECVTGTAGSIKCKSCDMCSATTPCGPVPPCPPGCELPDGEWPVKPSSPSECDLSPIAADGYCSDGTFGTDQYFDGTESTTAEDTPMVFYGGSLIRDEPCTAYGDAIVIIQKSNKDFADKQQALRQEAEANFGSMICNWNVARLECIPNSGVRPTLPPVVGGGGGGGGGPDGSYTSDIWDVYRRREGTCQCMMGLGPKAVYIIDENSRDGKPKCYIPAGKGHHSNCGHNLHLPQGLIDYYNRREMKSYIREIVGPASQMCTPNSECKPGYKYVGVRCSCKKGYKFNPINGTCADAVRIKADSSRWGLYANSFIVILGWINLHKYFNSS